MQRIQIISYFIYFCVFVIGLVIGRITMAVQYEVMKPEKEIKEDNKPNSSDTSKPPQ